MIKLAELLDEDKYPEYSNDALVDMIINLSRFEGNEEFIASIKDELKRRKKTIPEATFTSKYDNSPKLKGKQTKLPDEIQAKIVKEGDHEVSMAVSSLEAIAEAIVELRQKLGNQERNIPGWIQDHIAKAENYIEQAAQGFHELKNDE
jgi:uncharacterized heparinase superfamily protein